MKKSCNVWIHLSSFTYLEPHGQPFINGFQLDDSKSLYRKWLEITKHPFKKMVGLGVPGRNHCFPDT